MAFLFYEQSNAAQMGIMLLLWPLRKKTQERDLDGTKIVNVVKENSMVRYLFTQKWFLLRIPAPEA